MRKITGILYRIQANLKYTLKLSAAFACIILVSGFQPLHGQQTPFSKGVNLTNWFQAGSAGQIQFSKYTKQDFENIKTLDCDVIRLPINLHYMTDGEPDYILDPLFLGFLDEAVDWAEELDIHLILDNHTFDVSSDTDTAVGGILEKVWTQMALHYRDSYSKIYYEILNEPHGIDDADWNTIQLGVINAIREVDSTHTIVVGGAGWNSYNNLAAMPEYADTNLIYTYHFYDPFLFTHQGASWVDPSMEPLAGIPYPYDADSMPALPSSLVGSWVGSNYNDYHKVGYDSIVKQWLDIAITFRDQRKVPIFCGEFGVFMPNSDDEDRIRWYELVTSYLTEHEVGWTAWDYHGGFGVFEEGGHGLFQHDLNIPLLEAMGLNTPEQTEYELNPDSLGFMIYDDYIGPGITEDSYGSGVINFYSTDNPNNGSNCIRWDGPAQYQIIGFNFSPDKDMSALVDSGYALDFMVRGHVPGTKFDMRFIDTKTDATDHPWRMSTTIDETKMSMDGKWYHVHIPLADFWESGSWDDETWFNQEGLYDWSAVGRFEIVSEHGGLENAALWFDNISITTFDTAQVLENTVFSDTTVLFDTIVLVDLIILVDSLEDVDTIVDVDSIVHTEILVFTDTITTTDSIMTNDTITFFYEVYLADTVSYTDTASYIDIIRLVDTIWRAADTVAVIVSFPSFGLNDIRIFPNPVHLKLYLVSQSSERLALELFDLSGRLLMEDSFTDQIALDTGDLPEGIYILKLSDIKGYSRQFKLLKQ